MNRQEIIDILNTIYIRYTRLQLSCKTFWTIFYSPSIKNDYPNLCWCMATSFATDAYTTIDGLMHSGRYSFATLAANNDDINAKYKDIMEKIECIIPDIHNIRNRMFCHLVEKQANSAIQSINAHCGQLLDCLKELHIYCCHVYNINVSELNGYNNDTFSAFDRELNEFNQVLMNGSMSLFHDMLAKIQSGKSFQDAKEIRYKQIKSEA